MNRKTKIVIIDDDLQAITKLEGMLCDYPDLECSGRARNGIDGLELLSNLSVDLLFLDIELPDVNGIDLLKKIEKLKKVPYVVMFTAVYHEYSDEAFSHCESDYLLKPVNPKELDKVIQRYRHYSMSKASTTNTVPIQSATPDFKDVLAVNTYTSEMRILRLSEIGYFRYSSKRRIWEVAISDGSFVALKKGTSASDIIKHNKKFVQTHQSYIINMDYMLLVGQNAITLYPPFNSEEIPLGRIFKKDLQDYIICI